jgi:hypothetical protein
MKSHLSPLGRGGIEFAANADITYFGAMRSDASSRTTSPLR